MIFKPKDEEQEAKDNLVLFLWRLAQLEELRRSNEASLRELWRQVCLWKNIADDCARQRDDAKDELDKVIAKLEKLERVNEE